MVTTSSILLSIIILGCHPKDASAAADSNVVIRGLKKEQNKPKGDKRDPTLVNFKLVRLVLVIVVVLVCKSHIIDIIILFPNSVRN